MAGLQELVIDAANEGNMLIGWKKPPMAQIIYFSLCQYRLFIAVQPCPSVTDLFIGQTSSCWAGVAGASDSSRPRAGA